jgi:hypothetical protein
MFCCPCIVIYQYSETNVMHYLFNLLRIKASTYFEHYLLILRRLYTNGTCSIACVLCQLAEPEMKSLYMFRVLLAHPQEALYTRHLVYGVLVMSVGAAN